MTNVMPVRLQMRRVAGTMPRFMLRAIPILLCSIINVQMSNSLPTVLVPTDGSHKCFQVQAPRDSILRVAYDAPGTIMIGEKSKE
jgi:hypothetical protein